MSRYRVSRDGDGWKITKGGRRLYKKTYDTKQQALESARSAASKGDSVQGQKFNGRWGRENTKQSFGPSGDK